MFPGRKKMAHSQLKSLLTLSRAVRVEGALAPPGGSLSHPHLVERVIYSYTSPIILQEEKKKKIAFLTRRLYLNALPRYSASCSTVY